MRASKPRKFGFDLTTPVLLLFAAVLCVLIVMPLSWLVYYAFTDKAGTFTVANFQRLVTDACSWTRRARRWSSARRWPLRSVRPESGRHPAACRRPSSA